MYKLVSPTPFPFLFVLFGALLVHVGDEAGNGHPEDEADDDNSADDVVFEEL